MGGVRQGSLHREEGSGHTATIESLPWQKLAVTNEIRALQRLHPLPWSSSYVTTYLADVSCSMTRPLLPVKGAT